MLPAFATCPKGLEALLFDEVCELGGENVRQTLAGVRFEAALITLYRVCLWSRLANRVLLELDTFGVESADDLYAGISALRWDEHLSPDSTFAVSFTGTNDAIRQTNFGALKAKDAIVDRFLTQTGKRPDVDAKRPDLRVHINLRHTRASVSVDMSGESLHKRGYRVRAGVAPLKENLAAALLVRADWPAIAGNGGGLIDPLCGSGTLLVEAAWMAMGTAPGLLRERWGFTHWRGHESAVFETLVNQAKEQHGAALSSVLPPIVGYDKNETAIAGAKVNLERAGLSRQIQLRRQPLARLEIPREQVEVPGLLITNPPYGRRLNDETSLAPLYTLLGEKLRTYYEGWRAALLTGNPELGKTMGLRSRRQYQLFNGTIPSKLLLFDVNEGNYVSETAAGVRPQPRLSTGAQMFANRLAKNWKHLDKWRRRNAISCYRLYDADIPEYSVAVDIYNDWVHLAEYKAPSSIEPATAENRLREVVSAIPGVTGISPEQVVIKQRQHQRGRAQYQKHPHPGPRMEVREGEARLLVNLHDYLDTGLFLDHRRLRLGLHELVRGKRFLNLFCYTASATVHAALGGACESVSVDLSTTYIDWARSNFALNHIDTSRHRLVKTDCRRWLCGKRDRFDVILLDPPTFSNSKSMQGTLDVERDHRELIDAAVQQLSSTGLLIFSSNRRKLELDRSILNRHQVKDMTSWSLDRDYARDKPAHRCWFIRPSS